MKASFKKLFLLIVQVIGVFVIGSLFCKFLYYRGTSGDYPYSAWISELKYALLYLAGIIWIAAARILNAINQLVEVIHKSEH